MFFLIKHSPRCCTSFNPIKETIFCRSTPLKPPTKTTLAVIIICPARNPFSSPHCFKASIKPEVSVRSLANEIILEQILSKPSFFIFFKSFSPYSLGL